MSGRWWRAYSRARHDPKLLRLPDKDFRWWFNLLCVAGENGGRLPYLRDLAAEFRTTEHAVAVAIERLRLNGLFEIEGEPGLDVIYRPCKWNVLQYQSDVSTTRVKRFRERQCNVSVTPSESEADTETDSVAKATGADAPDPVKLVFDAGVKILTATGLKEPQARSLIGKWRKDHGDEQVLAAIGSCQRSNVSEPISWITATFKAEKTDRETHDQRRIRLGREALRDTP